MDRIAGLVCLVLILAGIICFCTGPEAFEIMVIVVAGIICVIALGGCLLILISLAIYPTEKIHQEFLERLKEDNPEAYLKLVKQEEKHKV